MKIVITGALGHIGSYLIRKLPYQFPDAEFLLIDNIMTQRFSSLFCLPTIGRYQFLENDVTKMDLRPVLDDAHVVIHLAAITDAASSFQNAEELEANNFMATRNVATACSKTDTRLISLSSTSVYGTQKDIVSEDCGPEELKPQSPYAETKLREEELNQHLSEEEGLEMIICRFGTICGASIGMRFHTAVNKFCWQAVMGKPITVWKTAYEQKRPYLDLLDAERAFTFIIENDIFDGRVYNVLTKNATVEQIIETIQKFVPQLEIDFVESEIMNQLSYEVSRKRFENQGFNFVGSLKRAIGETIEKLRRANNKE